MKKILAVLVATLIAVSHAQASSPDVLSIEDVRIEILDQAVRATADNPSPLVARYATGDLEYVEAYIDGEIIPWCGASEQPCWDKEDHYGMRIITLPPAREAELYLDIRNPGYLWVDYAGQTLESYIPGDWTHGLTPETDAYVCTSQVFLEVEKTEQRGTTVLTMRADGNRAGTFEDYVLLRPGNTRVISITGGEMYEGLVIADETPDVVEFEVVLRGHGDVTVEAVFGASQSVAELNMEVGESVVWKK